MKTVKYLICLFLCFGVSLFFVACTNNQSNFEDFEETTEEINEEVTEQLEEPVSEYIEFNEDGVAAIDEEYSQNARIYDHCFDGVNDDSEEPSYDDPASWFYVFTKRADERIIKLKQEDVAAIYSPEESVLFLKISSEPKYTLPLNFEDGLSVDGVEEYPAVRESFGTRVSGYNDEPFGDTRISEPGNPIEEVNGQPLEEYINENSYVFWRREYQAAPIFRYKIMTCNADEKVTFGGYINTEWREATVPATVEYYQTYYNEPYYDIIPEKTKNGYFTVDTSKLEKGLYFVYPFNNFIEIV